MVASLLAMRHWVVQPGSPVRLHNRIAAGIGASRMRLLALSSEPGTHHRARAGTNLEEEAAARLVKNAIIASVNVWAAHHAAQRRGGEARWKATRCHCSSL